MKVSDAPLVFVYIPRVPCLEGGKVIWEDPMQNWVNSFKNICEKKEIGFIDMTPSFRDFVSKNNSFPMGLNNGELSKGHLNSNGHHLIAQALAEYLERDIDAVFPN